MSMRERRRAPAHPGGILKRLYLDALSLSNSQLACSIGVSRKTVSKIVNEKSSITPDTALRLSRALNTTPDLWLNLQKNYDLWQASHGSTDWPKAKAIIPPAENLSDPAPADT
jgi:addiction module HigA family antidote